MAAEMGDDRTAAEIEAARGQLDPRTFRQEFEASFENLSGLVAVSFSDANIDARVWPRAAAVGHF